MSRAQQLGRATGRGTRVAVLAARHAVRRVGLYPAGVAMLAAAAALALVGWTTRWYEFQVAALLCLALVLVALCLTIGRSHYAIDLRLSGRRVVVGDHLTGALAITNQGARRTLPARVDVAVGPEIATFQVPGLAASAEHQGTFTVPTERRGVVPIGPVRTVRGDPFGLTGRETRWSDVVEVFVHPRTVPLPGRQAGFVHDLEGHPSASLSASDISFHALREYVPGDDRRHVHWRSTARTGSLMVRQFEETRQSHVAIGVDLSPESWFTDDEFETGVSVAASIAQQAHRESNPLSVFAADERLAAVHARRTFDELSRVERRGGATFFGLVETLRTQAAGSSVVVVVTGSNVPLDRVRAGSATLDVDARVLAVQVDPAAPPTVRGVANVTVVRLQRLDELPRALRRAMS